MDQLIDQLKSQSQQNNTGEVQPNKDILCIQQKVLSLIIDSHIQATTTVKAEDSNSKTKDGLITTINQLDGLIDEICKIQPNQIINLTICEQIAQLYITLLSHDSLKLYQCSNKFITMFDTDLKNKKDLNLLLSITCLTAIYQNFGKEITSFIPLLVTTCLKQVKESLNSMISLSYATLLTTVIKVIYQLNYDHHMLLTESHVSKYLKLINSKSLQNHNKILGELFTIFGQATILSSSQTVTIAAAESIDIIRYKKMYLTQYIIPAFKSTHFEIRSSIAKSISTVLGTQLNLHQIIKFYYEVYDGCIDQDPSFSGHVINGYKTDESLGIEIFQSLIDLIINKETASGDLNEHIMDYFKELMDVFLGHHHINYDPLIRQLLLVSNCLIESLSDMFKVSFFDKLHQLLQQQNDDTLNESQMVLVLESMKILLNGVDHSLNVDKYQIVLIQLSLSSTTDLIRNKAIDTLVLLVRHSPIIMKTLLRNFFNEIKQNNKSNIDKNLGMSLIVSKLLTVSQLDDPIKDNVWKFGFNYIKANQDDPFFSCCCWSLITGFLSCEYSDKEYLASVINDFKTIWITTTESSSYCLLNYQLTAMDVLINFHISEIEVDDLNFFLQSSIKIMKKFKTSSSSSSKKEEQIIEKKLYKIFYKFDQHFSKNFNFLRTSSILIGSVYNLIKYPTELTSKWIDFQKSKRCLNWLNEWSYHHHHDDSIIDSSIGIFIGNFSMVSEKIQLSLIEIMRNFILTDPHIILTTNISFAINKALIEDQQRRRRRRRSAINGQIKANLLDILYLLYEICPNEEILHLNSESIGYLLSNEQSVPLIISKIVNNDDWRMRCFNAMVLHNIYKYGHIQFQEIFSVLISLMKDTNTNVHHYSMVAITGLIESHKTMLQLEHVNEILFCLKCSNSTFVLKLIKNLVINLGFDLKKLKEFDILKNILLQNLFLPKFSEIQMILLEIFNELIIFNPEMIPLELILQNLKIIMINNLTNYRLGNGKFQFLLTLQTECQPLDCSNLTLLQKCLELILNIYKIKKSFQLPMNLENLYWCMMEKYPNLSEVVELLNESINLSKNLPKLMEKYILNFNKSRIQILHDYLEFEKSIINKRTPPSTKDETKDEESQSINTSVDLNNDPINWKFKYHLVTSIIIILEKSNNSELNIISNQIEQLIKISFNASTSSIMALKSQGIKLLRVIITNFADFKDPFFPQFTLLHQQQAQIVSAIIPAFDKNSNSNTASDALEIIGLLIGKGIINRLNDRLVVIFKEALEVSNKHESIICDVPLISTADFKNFQISVLNAWAELGINCDEQNHLFKDHLDILLPQWISILKQYTALSCRAGGSNKQGLLLLLSLVKIIRIISFEQFSFQIKSLLKTDTSSFYYVVYADCLYLLTTIHNQQEIIIVILESITGLLHSSLDLVRLIYENAKIFNESYEVWKRLLCVSSSKIQMAVIEICIKFFKGIVNLNDEISEHFIEKLFELIELVFLPLNNSSSDVSKIFNSVLDDMIYQLPQFLMSDLMLVTFKFTMRYAKNHSFALSIIKKILLKFKDLGAFDVINQIYQRVDFEYEENGINSLLLFTILLNVAQEQLFIHNSTQISELIQHQLVNDKDNVQITIQSIKSIISNSVANTSSSIIIRQLSYFFLMQIHQALPLSENSKISLELYIFILKTNSDKNLPLYKALIPILLNLVIEAIDQSDKEYIRNKLNYIISIDQEFFKRNIIMNGTLSDIQRGQLMSLLQA